MKVFDSTVDIYRKDNNFYNGSLSILFTNIGGNNAWAMGLTYTFDRLTKINLIAQPNNIPISYRVYVFLL